MIIRQTYLNQIIPLIDKNLIKVITGVRRSGKTVLLSQIRDYLLEQGKSREQIICLNFESIRNKDYTRILMRSCQKSPGLVALQ